MLIGMAGFKLNVYALGYSAAADARIRTGIGRFFFLKNTNSRIFHKNFNGCSTACSGELLKNSDVNCRKGGIYHV